MSDDTDDFYIEAEMVADDCAVKIKRTETKIDAPKSAKRQGAKDGAEQ